MERVSGIGGAFVPAQDPARLGRWYAEHFGAKSVVRADGLMLFATAPAAERAEGTPERPVSISFEVTGVDGIVEQLRAAGATIENAPEDCSGDGVAVLRDPEQNLVQLVEFAPARRAWSAEPEAVRILEDDEQTAPARRSSWRRRAPWLPLLLAGAVALVFIATRQPDTDANPPAPTPAERPFDRSPRGGDDAVSVVDVGDRVLGVTAGWELIAYGVDTVVRVELARGRVTTTALPDVRTIGSVSLVAGPDWVIVRPLDNVTGYLVPDGEPARDLRGGLRGGGLVFPGPRPEHVWVENRSPGTTRELSLRSADGDRVGPSLRAPVPVSGQLTSDGAGHVLVPATGGTYVMRPSGLRRVTTGEVDAAGPNHLLVTECDKRARCSRVLVTRVTGQRRTLDDGVSVLTAPQGAVAPDGVVAAVTRVDGSGRSILTVMDLATGEERSLDVSIRPGFVHSGVVFSPDGDWLFAASLSGAVLAVDTGTFRVHELGFRLPTVTQLTLRPAR